MTGSAKQSTATKKTGLLRRFAPRNDEIQRERNADVLRRWIYRRGPEEEPWGLPQHGEEGGQDLARAWRAGLPRMGGRGRQGRKAHLVPAQRQAQARRDRDLLLDHLQVARATRSRQRQGNGRQAAGRHDGHQVAAVRRQADDLWRLRKPREGVKRAYAAASPFCSPAMARSMASITIWVSMNLSRARSALSRSNGAARVFAKASRSSAMRSRAFFNVSSRSLISASLSVDHAISIGAKNTARSRPLTWGWTKTSVTPW